MDLRAILHAWCGDHKSTCFGEALVSGGFPDCLSESSWI